MGRELQENRNTRNNIATILYLSIATILYLSMVILRFFVSLCSVPKITNKKIVENPGIDPGTSHIPLSAI